MSTIVTRAGKGSPLTNTEVDSNFTNLNTDKIEAGTTVTLTNKTLTSPRINEILDTSGNEILGLSPTASATDFVTVKNGIGTGVPLHVYADGPSTNIGLHIQPKGSGLVTISDGTDFNKGIRFRSSSSAASAITLLDAVSTAGRVVTLPDATTTLVGRDTTDTLTNKTINLTSNTLVATSAQLLAAITDETGTGSLVFNTSPTFVTPILGTPTSGNFSTGTFTWPTFNQNTTGTAAGLSATLATTSGGTGLTSFTSGGVVYASSTSALATGGNFLYDGTNLSVKGTNVALRVFDTPNGNYAVFGTINGNTVVGATGGYSIRFDITGTEQMRLTSTLLYTASAINVAIGASSTTSKLYAVSGVNYNPSLTTGAASGFLINNAGQEISFGGSGVAPYPNYIQSRASGIGWDLNLNPLGGNVGIGTGSNAPAYKLEVASGASDANSLFNSTNANGAHIRLASSGTVKSYIGGAPGFLASGTADDLGIRAVGSVLFATNGSGVDMALDTAGNLGLGVTPSAWISHARVLQMPSASFTGRNDGGIEAAMLANAYRDSAGTRRYVANGVAMRYEQSTDGHVWFTAPSGTAGDAISFTQAVTLNASGRFGIGETSPQYKLDILGATGSIATARVYNGSTGGSDGAQLLLGNSANYTNAYFRLNGGGNTSQAGAGSLNIGVAEAVPMAFYTANVERGRFSSTGLNVTGAITENNVAVVTQSDIGTAPNEIPLNQYLGSMAYQNGDAYYNTGMTVGFRNRIINGAMQIDQRNAGASSTFGNSGAYTTVDRWQSFYNTSGTATNQQVTDAPTGFSNSLKVTITGSATPSAAQLFQLVQYIEGNNIVDMAWGTASASSVSLSFWVKSSLTGQFGGAISNNAVTYAYPFNYNISAANTWERKTITIGGPTAGTWLTDANIGLRLYFNLGCGSNYLATANAWVASDKRGTTGDTNLVSTNSATWYVTGVQVEKGNIATSFDVRPYGTELALCQRYANSTFPIGTAWATAAGRAGDLEFLSSGTSSRIYVNYVFSTTMRATPTVIYYNPTNNNTNFYSWSSSSDASAAGSFGNSSSKGQMIVSASNAPATDATFGIHVSFSAEL